MKSQSESNPKILEAKNKAIERSRNGRNPKSESNPKIPEAKNKAIERSRNGRNGPSEN